jgi:metal-responsive CopG/Arc/MetJ family transcriptional regulator
MLLGSCQEIRAMFRVYTTFTSNLIKAVNDLSFQRYEPRTHTVRMLLELGLDAYKERQLAEGRQSEVVAVTAESSSPMAALANSIKRAR